jgi:hypothetical protein
MDKQKRNARQHRWNAKNRDRVNGIARASYRRRKVADPEAYAALVERNRIKRQSLPFEKRRSLNLQRDHGITLPEFNSMFDAQKKRCAVCRREQVSGTRDWHVDHSHATGKIRGILCHHCNTGLGLMRDSPTVLRLAAEYLERNE